MKVYKFAHPRRHLAVIGLLILLISLLLLIIYTTVPTNITGFVWLGIILMAIIVAFTFGTITNKIILSPAGFKYISFGISLLMAWDTVEKVSFDNYGIVKIIFREPVFQNRWVNKILLPIDSGHAVQLSSFIDNSSSSNLIRDIKYFAPNCDISDIETRKNNSTKHAHSN